jgi:hypothetical protein
MRSDWGFACAARVALYMLLAALPGLQLRGADGDCSRSNGITVAATATSATSISLFWQVTPGLGGKPVTPYVLFRGTSPANLAQLAKTAKPLYADVGLQPATTYLYLVEAAVDGTVVSGSACATTPPFPNAPYDVTATPLSTTEVTLSWAQKIDPNSLAISEFRVYGGTSPSDLTQVATVQAVSATLNVSAGVTYYYIVVAVDVDGDSSPASAVIQVTMPSH